MRSGETQIQNLQSGINENGRQLMKQRIEEENLKLGNKVNQYQLEALATPKNKKKRGASKQFNKRTV